MTDTEKLCATLADVIEMHGAIDLLINNAAQDPGVRLADITVEDFRNTFDVNFFAPVAATLAVLPSMRAHGSGTIVNVSSDGGRLPSPGPGAYPSSKAALSAFSESTSFRLAPQGIDIHVVYPAFMATDLGLGASTPGVASAAPADRPPRRGGVTHHFGAGGGILAGDKRIEAHRRGHGVPAPSAEGLPSGPKELVNRSLRVAPTAAVSLTGTGS